MLEHCDNKNSHKQFLSQRIGNVWNSLPAAVVDFTKALSTLSQKSETVAEFGDSHSVIH